MVIKLNKNRGENEIKKHILNIEIVEIRDILQNMLWHDENRRWGFDQILAATE
jgi:hypothetical protein